VKYLLDTNVMIHLFRAKEPLNSKVQSRPPTDLAISGFTEAELRYGIEKSDLKSRAHNELARSLAIAPFTIVYHDRSISDAYGKVKFHLVAKKIYVPKNEIDIFIAATAIAKNLILVTNNTKDFSSIPGLTMEDWSSRSLTV
jgi:tRNA(fMet)-specific endonuclease VapC